MADTSLDPIQIIKDELENHKDKPTVLLRAVQRLGTIATALGPERTREDLLPQLCSSMEQQEEVLVAMAAQLGHFMEYVGGPAYGHLLLEPLRILCSAEDATVREKAVESCLTVARALSKEQVNEHLLPMAKGLATDDGFTSHITAPSLFASIYPQADDAAQLELRTLYQQLMKDPTLSVRRSAGTHLGKLALEMEPADVEQMVLPLFKAIAADEQDSVRLLAVQVAVDLSEKLEAEQVTKDVMPVVFGLSRDKKSWRVRYMVASNLAKLSLQLTDDVNKAEALSIFVNLLRDGESEVRTAAALCVSDFSKLLTPEEICDSICPPALVLANDSSEHVRVALASVVTGLCEPLGKEKAQAMLFNLFLQLLRDESSDVRLNVISSLDVVNQVVGIDSISDTLLPAVIQLAEDKKWRVRLSIINYLPILAKQLGAEFFSASICELCLSWLGDPVFVIRDAAVHNIRSLIEIFGLEWAQSSIIPKVLNFHSHQNYLYRMTTLMAISAFGSAMSDEAVESTLVPIAVRMADDTVANIRFNVAKTLQALSGHVDEKCVQRQIRPVLNRLYEDLDADVKYFAHEALQALGA